MAQRKLFCLLDSSEVYSAISAAPEPTANIWEYAYFAALPPDSVNHTELQRLYDFLKKDNDQLIKSSPFRDIVFVNKFSDVDKDVLLRASEIIMSKQSPFIVNIYFGLLFNINCHSPADVVNMFSKKISLLEEIYIIFIFNWKPTMHWFRAR